MMTPKEFTNELQVIRDGIQAQIVALVHRARTENTASGDIAGSDVVDFADDPNWQRYADGITESGAWIYDRLNGCQRSGKKTVAKKIRRALGYTYP
jgi:hypothetical protein